MSYSALDEMFAAAIGLDTGFDEETGMGLIFAEDGPEIFLRADRDTGRLTLFSELAQPDEEQRELLKLPLLHANFDDQKTNGNTIGLTEGTVFLSHQETFATVDAPRFLDVVARFAATADHWREQITQPVTEWTAPEALSTLVDTPEAELLHRIIAAFLEELLEHSVKPDASGSYYLTLGDEHTITVEVDSAKGVQLTTDLGKAVTAQPGFIDKALQANLKIDVQESATVSINPSNGHAVLSITLPPSIVTADTFRSLLEVMANSVARWTSPPEEPPAPNEDEYDPLFLLKQIRI